MYRRKIVINKIQSQEEVRHGTGRKVNEISIKISRSDTVEGAISFIQK